MIFLTGGTGIIGSQLLMDLTLANETVRVLYRSKNRIEQLRTFFKHFHPESYSTLFARIEWVEGDILDITSLEKHMTGCNRVYHCAALVSFHSSDFKRMLKINREGTANVVNLCLDLGVEKLCYISSTAAIGGASDAVITEETPWKNTPTTTGYSISKYSAEKEVWRGIEEGLNAVIVNPCVVLGAGNWDESSLTVFRSVQKRSSFYPPGSNAIVDARDVSQIMRALMKSEIHSERFLCIGNNQSFKTLISVIAQQLGKTPPKYAVPRWLVGIARVVSQFVALFGSKKPALTKETVQTLFSDRTYSAEKVKRTLNYKFYTLEETVEFALKNRLG